MSLGFGGSDRLLLLPTVPRSLLLLIAVSDERRLFCRGSDFFLDEDVDEDLAFSAIATSTSCVVLGEPIC